MATNRKKLGAWGEVLAREYLEKLGYAFVVGNWTAVDGKKMGEIDLIMEKADTLLFVEVKTRTVSLFGPGQEAVSWRKKQKIKLAIGQFLLENKKYAERFPRFDIVAVELFTLTPRFTHIENVELGE